MAMQRLDGDADKVIKLAQTIAKEYELEYVGTEHILLAILRHNDGVATRVLTKLGIDESRGTAAVEELIRSSNEDTWVFGRLPGSPHFKNVMAAAIEEAQQLESKNVGCEHLLLGLLRERGCVADRALSRLGVTLSACREEIISDLSK